MTSEISFRIFLQVEVVKFLLRANAEVRSKDKFDNTSLNDAVRHRSEFNKEPCLFFFFFWGGGLCKHSFRLEIRHDEVATLLRSAGATLNLQENQAGVLMCQVCISHILNALERSEPHNFRVRPRMQEMPLK